MSSPALLPRWRALQLLRHAGPRTLHANLIGRGNRSFASGGPRQSSSFGLRDTSKTTTSTTGSTEETLTVDENVGGSEAEESTEWTESFGDVAGELMRRRRKTEAKRLQRGGFLDHLTVSVRGGRGGNGAAAFSPTRTGATGPPSGGNGGTGGSVYLRTSPTLTSLHTLRRRYVGGSGYNGKGDLSHGKPGEDMFIEVPVGTVLTETKRVADESGNDALASVRADDTEVQGQVGRKNRRQWQDEREVRRAQMANDTGDETQVEENDMFEDEPMDEPEPLAVAVDEGTEEERRLWAKAFVLHPGAQFTASEYRSALRALRKAGRAQPFIPSFDDTPRTTHDLESPILGRPILLARGGTGGAGNPFFTGFASHRQPRLAQRGQVPYISTFELELKIIADVGLVGFPNAGKSTILRALTGRRAEVAGYSFTTLNPQVGVVRVMSDGTFAAGEGVVEETWLEREQDELSRLMGEYQPLPRAERVRLNKSKPDEDGGRWEISRFTIADNPGLLPQASENVGLGHSFLRSIERSLALAYVLDITRPSPAQDLMALRIELDAYKDGLTKKGAVVMLNKGDDVGEEEGRRKLEEVKRTVQTLPESQQMTCMVLSGKYGLGLERMVKRLGERVKEEKAKAELVAA